MWIVRQPNNKLELYTMKPFLKRTIDGLSFWDNSLSTSTVPKSVYIWDNVSCLDFLKYEDGPIEVELVPKKQCKELDEKIESYITEGQRLAVIDFLEKQQYVANKKAEKNLTKHQNNKDKQIN